MIQAICHNCGLPSDCCPSKGHKIQITRKAENGYRRESKRTVWCHSKECAVQALAVAKYGPATHKWPITLAQFRGTRPLQDEKRPLGWPVIALPSPWLKIQGVSASTPVRR